MRKAILLLLALAAAAPADDDAVSKALGIAKAGPAAARERIPELIAISKSGPVERFAARDALVVAGPHAVAALIEGASGDQSLRLLLEGVSFDLGAGVVAPALAALSNESPKVRAMAAVSLGAAGKGGEAAVKQLIVLLHDKDAEVRREAANALGAIGRGAHDAVPGLIHLANDPDRGCTREAILALGRIVRDAAERGRPVPKPSDEVATAIEKGLSWLARQQMPDGSWAVPPSGDAAAPDEARAYVAALAILAMLESVSPDSHAAQRDAALRFVAATKARSSAEPWSVNAETVTAAFCAATRVLGEPECRAAAARGLEALSAQGQGPPSDLALASLAALEAGFAGLLRDPPLLDTDAFDVGPIPTALALLSAGTDPDADGMRKILASCAAKPEDPESWALAARARALGSLASPAIIEATLKAQREDGSWEVTGNVLGPAHATACMLLALEAAAGLARPLTLPLPDAPQLRAAVATLRVAAESKDVAIRAAAEQALAGFGR